MAETAVTGTLGAFGIEPSAEDVYRADRVGREVGTVELDVTALVESGLVSLAGKRVTADRPQLAIGQLLARESRNLVAAEAALARARIQVSHYEVEHETGLRPGTQTIGLDLIDPA